MLLIMCYRMSRFSNKIETPKRWLLRLIADESVHSGVGQGQKWDPEVKAIPWVAENHWWWIGVEAQRALAAVAFGHHATS